MPNTLGEDMKGFVDRYSIDFDGNTKTWRILDFKHPEASKLPPLDQLDIDVPDDHPAMTVLPELMFAKLISEAVRIGELSPSIVGIRSDKVVNEDVIAEVERLNTECNVLEAENKNLKEKLDKIPIGSEGYLLKSKVVDALRGIAIAEDIVNEIK